MGGSVIMVIAGANHTQLTPLNAVKNHWVGEISKPTDRAADVEAH